MISVNPSLTGAWWKNKFPNRLNGLLDIAQISHFLFQLLQDCHRWRNCWLGWSGLQTYNCVWKIMHGDDNSSLFQANFQALSIHQLAPPVTSVSFSFFFFKVLIDLKKHVIRINISKAATNLLPYILSKLPQLLIWGCSCWRSLAAASCFPSFLFLQITATCSTEGQNHYQFLRNHLTLVHSHSILILSIPHTLGGFC